MRTRTLAGIMAGALATGGALGAAAAPNTVLRGDDALLGEWDEYEAQLNGQIDKQLGGPYGSPEEEMEAYLEWLETLPAGTESPRSPAPDAFNWDEAFILFDNYSFVGPSSQQWWASGCWLFSDVHALQVNSAYQAFLTGAYVAPPDNDMGIHLRPWVWWDCADLGVDPSVDGDVFDYGVTRWDHQQFGEHFGYAENCTDPVEPPGASGWAAKRTCGHCDRYRVEDPQDRPLWNDCSWVQSEHPTRVLAYRNEAAVSLDTSAFHLPDWEVGTVDYEGVLDLFADHIFNDGPLVVVLANNRVPTGINGVWTCSNSQQDAEYHLVTVVAYDKADPDYNGQRTVTIQDSTALGTKALYKYDFDAFVTPWQQDGCSMGWYSHYFPNKGAKAPFEMGRFDTTVADAPLRCDVDGDGVDGFIDPLNVDNCPEVYNPSQSGGCDACQPGASTADDADNDGVGDVCIYESTDCNIAGDSRVSLPVLATLAMLGFGAACARRRR
jgi:hypothetical protein